MRFGRLAIKGIGTRTFAEPFEVDLDALPGTLVAFTGTNGVGKTTALECLGGAVYRECPSYGLLADLARDRDSYVETTVTSDATYRIRHTLDGVTGKGEVLVLGEDGAPVLKTTSVRAFDAWVKDHFPTPLVAYAGLFAVQGASGFLGMKEGDQKAVLLRALGIEAIEGTAKACRTKAAEAEAALKLAVTRLEDERARGASVRDAELRVEAARAALERAEADEGPARERVAVAQRQAEEHRAAVRAHAEATRWRAAIEGEIAQDRTRLADVELRERNNRAVLAEGDAIRAALARVEAIDAEHATVTAELTGLQAAVDAALAARHHHREAGAGALDRFTRARVAASRIAPRTGGRVEAEAAARSLDVCRAEVTKAEAWLAGAGAEFQRWIGLATDGAGKRIEGLRGALEGIVEVADWNKPDFVDPGIGEAGERASAALEADDALAKEAGDAPAQVRRVQRAQEDARRAVDAAQRQLTNAERAAARLPDIEAAERELADATLEVNAAEAALEAHGRRSAEIEAQLGAAETALAPALLRAQELVGERARVAPPPRKVEALGHAAARLEELAPAIAHLRGAIAAKEAERDAIAVPAVEPFDAEAAIGRAQSGHALALDAVTAARSAIGVAGHALEAARLREEAIGKLEAARAQAEEDLADWTLLAEDTGRDGLQAALIDAAGPELTELVNDLLHTCHGPRFTMRIEASRLSADGKETLDGCEVSVLDTVEGRDWANAKKFCGGEKVILGEALSLGITMLACRRAGLAHPTLVRDESGAALASENAPVYVAMLRRAAALVQASKVLFVSHNPEMVALADAVVDLGAVRARVDDHAPNDPVATPEAA